VAPGSRPLAEPAASSILIWGDGLRDYDFGPGHPLTPRRFGPGIDILLELGAQSIVVPRLASDEELARLHAAHYIEQVRSFSEHPWQPPAMGIGTADVPAFHGMHEASALVAGGSLDAIERILSGEVEHAFSPAGGLHHAMRTRAAGFCVYNDVALAVARARDAGHRVLYVDLDVHHGDGTQTLFWDDPAVLTFSIHETGRRLFPGTGMPDETGGDDAPGTAVNVPLDEGSGDESWWPIVELMVPVLAEAFQPTFIVSQHGCDSHALDPLAHLCVTTAAYQRACRLIDGLAHGYCEGRWLATGGGGYDAFRVVPRSWAIVWLAQAHRDVPEATPPGWRERWAEAALAYGQAPLPDAFIDPAGMLPPDAELVVRRNHERARGSLEEALRLMEALARPGPGEGRHGQDEPPRGAGPASREPRG
jgi:acetoin utilization protein AcuC